MVNLKSLNAENFDQAVSSGVVLIDFWAEWCGPCKMMLPIMEEVATAVQGRAIVAKINVDESNSLASQFGVHNIPAFFLLKDGQVIEQWIGVQSKTTLIEAIEKALV